MKPSRFQVSSLRKCDTHKNCMVAGLDQHVSAKSAGKGASVGMGGYATHHFPASQATSFMPGQQVDVQATPVGKKRPVAFSKPSDNDGDETI